MRPHTMLSPGGRVCVFVLLHDAFQGGWVWRRVARALRDEGCEVHTPTLSGCGERNHQKISEEAPIAVWLDDMESLFRYEEIGDAVLVCSGFTGMLAPSLASRLGKRIGKVIYLDAVPPLPGERFLDIAPEPLARLIKEHLVPGAMVVPFLRGLPRYFEHEGAATKLTPFPMQGFEAAIHGPPPDDWPPSLCVSFLGAKDPLGEVMRNRARFLGIEALELNLDATPVSVSHQEIARVLRQWAPDRHTPEQGACGANRMPEAMRLLYCPRARLRHALKTRHTPPEAGGAP